MLSAFLRHTRRLTSMNSNRLEAAGKKHHYIEGLQPVASLCGCLLHTRFNNTVITQLPAKLRHRGAGNELRRVQMHLLGGIKHLVHDQTAGRSRRSFSKVSFYQTSWCILNFNLFNASSGGEAAWGQVRSLFGVSICLLQVVILLKEADGWTDPHNLQTH